MRVYHFCSFALVFATIILPCFSYFSSEAKLDRGFTVDLIHRDSPKSPFYNPSLSHYDRVKHAFQRSFHRAKYAVSTDVFPNGGEYLMEISYGTPPFSTLAIIDTGSDLSWTQCLPCTKCYKEKYPPFNPANSSTYDLVPCNSSNCGNTGTHCNQNETTCLYEINYADGSYTHGDLATETITFNSGGNGISVPNFVFGCGHENEGSFSDEGSGLVGLGFDSLSLISQLDSLIQGRFSYCLTSVKEPSKSGKINFGGAVTGVGVVSTPTVLNNYYYLTLEGISVASTRLNYSFSQNPDVGGNIIIDSGTTATYLPSELYQEFESTMKIELKPFNIVSDPLQFFSLCYSSLPDDQIPPVTVHFKGADLKMEPGNLFVSTSDSSVCLAFIPSDDVSIFGNISQSNFWVGYDLENKVVSFKPSDCTNN